jgi:kynurenine formamidase
MREEEVLELFNMCDNTNKWKGSAARGTLNYQTPSVSLGALSEVSRGHLIPLGRALTDKIASSNYTHKLIESADGEHSIEDSISIACHGWDITHLDAIGHTFRNGLGYLGAKREEVVFSDGLRSGSITDISSGVFTRGILLDVPGALGVEHLQAGQGISRADLERVEKHFDIFVKSGDAVFIRSGIDNRISYHHEDQSIREGIMPDVLPWLHEREVSIYSGDCIEQLPSGYPLVPMPLHQIGHTKMGLAILDNVFLMELLEYCRTIGKYTFLLTFAPLGIIGGTASPVNPLAIF